MSNTKYDSGLREKVIRLHLEEGRSLRSLTEEFNLGSGTAKYWVDKYRKDCSNSEEGIKQLEDHSSQKELLKRIEELEKENRFLKKAAAFFAKEID